MSEIEWGPWVEGQGSQDYLGQPIQVHQLAGGFIHRKPKQDNRTIINDAYGVTDSEEEPWAIDEHTVGEIAAWLRNEYMRHDIADALLAHFLPPKDTAQALLEEWRASEMYDEITSRPHTKEERDSLIFKWMKATGKLKEEG